MELEILHVTAGDKKRRHDTKTEAGRQEAKETIDRLLRRGTALFLERGYKSGSKRTYRITGYDAKNDRLIVKAEVKGATKKLGARGSKSKVIGVAPIAGG